MKLRQNCAETPQIEKDFCSGDPSAFCWIYKKYNAQIASFVRKRGSFFLRNSDDIVQNIFKKIFEKRNNFNPEKGSLSTWIYTIAAREAVNFYRRNKKNTVAIDQTCELEYVSEGKLDVSKIISCLDELESRIIFMRLFNKNSFEDIANALEIPEGTVKTKFYRSIEKLRQKIDILGLD